MKKKLLFNLFGILLGAITCFSFSSVQATTFWNNTTRSTLTAYTTTNFTNTDVTLGISGTRESGDVYTFNPNTTGEAKTIWKIAQYTAENPTVRDYSNLYYCLNVERGFGITNGDMAEGATDVYSDGFDMKDSTKISTITNLAGGSLETNYNKILWILDNSYIPSNNENYKTLSEYVNLMENANITIKNDVTDLTEEQIEAVQQMAIWYFTNSSNNTYNSTELPSLYLNGTQLTNNYYATDNYGTQIDGRVIQEKMNTLYKYFIESASSTYESVIPTLTVSKSNVNVIEDNVEQNGNYIVGPFSLTATNKELIEAITAEVNVDYTLLYSDSSEDVVSNNDFTKVVGENFYLKIAKSNITENTKIEINLKYKYNVRTLTFITDANDAENTQPVVLVKEEEKEIPINTTANIELPKVNEYFVKLQKVSQDGNTPLSGAWIKVNDGQATLIEESGNQIASGTILDSGELYLEYKLEETVAPQGYTKLEEVKTVKINAQIELVENEYQITNISLIENIEGITVTEENNIITIKVKNKPVDKKFDLSLRKFITKVNDAQYSREPVVDTSTIVTTGTATYKHTKKPIIVQKGDVVTYTIRVYNEGEVDGYVEMITDHLPENLKPIIEGVEGIDTEEYKDEIEFNSNWLWMCFDEGRTVTTTITCKSEVETYSILTGLESVTDTKLNAYVEGANQLDYIDVQIKCLVTENSVGNEYLTNIAEITKMCNAEGVEVETDIDSTKANADYSNLTVYKNDEAISSNTNSYIKGQEDDDDFEKIIVKEFDLSLRKFIIKVNDTTYSREPSVDTSKLGTIVDGKIITTATYTHSKEPVIVETNDLVTYTIRIYNEGSLDGYANEVVDSIPEGLEFLPDSSINVSYKWKMLDKDGNETEDISKAVMIVTDYLSDIDNNNVIKAVEETEGAKTLSYKDIQVQFKVTAVAKKLADNVIINEAQISEDSNIDIDSNPTRNEKYDYDFKENEDDIDYDSIKLQYFDLALRKFITKVNSVDYNNRYPEIVYNEDGSISYNHTKDPVLVTTEDIVIYTIRVYNEGDKAGYATEIIDNLPQGLEFLPEHEINKTYGWKLLDGEGNETEEVVKAVKISTDYLKDKIIDALVVENSQKILSYKDVQIAFKVTQSNDSDRILINTAEISSDSDDDVDSVPENDVLTEDDIDREYVKVQYFDLSLKKWVTATKVTLDGKTTTTKTGFTEDSEGIAKVDLVASKLKKTTVKFVYSIKVTNEGELPGYTYEIKDYIPNGLKFVAEDNPDWKELEDGKVVTEKLKDTLLNPGESATVEITLTWKNSTTNLSLKTNYAEISEDSGDDIDSTPDNFEKDEDDIDDAQVLLSIKTAGATTYVGLILASVAILASGIFLIKKYVI